MSQNETKHTFTPEQSQAMYETLQRIERDAPKTKTVHRQHLYEVVSNFYYAGCYIRETLQAIASTPAAPAGERPMYGVRFTHGKWYVWHEWGNYAWLPYDTEAEANAAARDLNASEQGGDNS